MHKIFVYATLMKGYWNHNLIIESDFLGKSITKEKYSLYYDERIPYLMLSPNNKIHGEVYSIDHSTLERLDRLEGHPIWYRREIISIDIKNTNKRIKAWAYFYPYLTGSLVESGDFSDVSPRYIHS